MVTIFWGMLVKPWKLHYYISFFLYSGKSSSLLHLKIEGGGSPWINTECSLCRERVVACSTFYEFKCAKIDILNSSTFKQ